MKKKQNNTAFSGKLTNEFGTRQFFVDKDGKQAMRSPMSATGKREDAQITPFLKQGVTNRMYELLKWDQGRKAHWLRTYWEEDITYEGSKKRVKRLCDQWRHMNMKADFAVPALTPEQYRAGAMVACPMQMSWGRLESIGVEKGVSSIAVGDLKIDMETTIGDLSRAIVSHNAGWQMGDRLSWIWLKQEEQDGLPIVKPIRWELWLEDSEEKVWPTIGSYGMVSREGHLVATIARWQGGFCWVHGGWREDVWRVSAQHLVMGENTEILDRYTSEEMWQKAAEAYREEGKKRDEAKADMTRGVKAKGGETIDMAAMRDMIREAVCEGVKEAMREVLAEWKG